MNTYNILNNEALLSGKTMRQVLIEAYALLRREDRWARFAFARDKDGRIVKAGDPEACCWDLQGAVAKCCNAWGVLPPCFMELFDSLAKEFKVEDANALNDQREHYDVLRVLEAAIRRVS